MWFSKQLNVTDFESCSVNNAHMHQQLKDHISSCFFLLMWRLPELAGWAELCSPGVTQCLPAQLLFCPWVQSVAADSWHRNQGWGGEACHAGLSLSLCGPDIAQGEMGHFFWSLTLPWQKRLVSWENWIPEVMSCPTGQEWPKSTIYPNRKRLKTSYQKIEQNIASVKCFHSEIKLASFTGLRKILINSIFTIG